MRTLAKSKQSPFARQGIALVVVVGLTACSSGSSVTPGLSSTPIAMSTDDGVHATAATPATTGMPGPTPTPTTMSSTTSTTAPTVEPTTVSGADSGAVEIEHSRLSGRFAFLGSAYAIAVGEMTIGYRQFGSGPDLLLIGGFAMPMDGWPPAMLEALAKSHRVTIYDNRDLGYSSDTSIPFSVADLSDDADALISVLGLDRPAVFGWSFGGAVALELAGRHSNALSALAISGTSAGGHNTVLAAPDIVECLRSGACDYRVDLQYSSTPDGTAAMIRDVNDWAGVQHPPSNVDAGMKYLAAEDAYFTGAEVDLDAINVPVIVMNGADDVIQPPANAEYIAQRIGDNARLELDPGGRHSWMFEHLDRFLLLLEQLETLVSR